MKYVAPRVSSGEITPFDVVCNSGYTCNGTFDASKKCKNSYFECNSSFKCKGTYNV